MMAWISQLMTKGNTLLEYSPSSFHLMGESLLLEPAMSQYMSTILKQILLLYEFQRILYVTLLNDSFTLDDRHVRTSYSLSIFFLSLFKCYSFPPNHKYLPKSC